MQRNPNRRSHGTGSRTVRRGKRFGRWRIGDQEISRVVGPVRQPAPGTASRASKPNAN